MSGTCDDLVDKVGFQCAGVDLANTMGEHVDYSTTLTVKATLQVEYDPHFVFTVQVSLI